MQCGIIAPRHGEMVGVKEDSFSAGCIRERCHDGPHVFKTSEGKFIAWEDDLECECCQSENCDEEMCIVYWEVAEVDVPHLKSTFR